MNRKVIRSAALALLMFILISLCCCGRKSCAPENAGPAADDIPESTVRPSDSHETECETEEKLSDEQALSAVRNYCIALNPDLKDIADAGEYPVYWEIVSSSEGETAVLFRSYTGAQKRFYIDRTTGDTYVTEFVPGITAEEQRTDESFNAKDYLSED